MEFKDIVDHANSILLSKWMSRLLDRLDSEWAQMYKANLELARWKSGHLFRHNLYTLEDRIFFGHISDFGAMKYSTRLCRAWNKLKMLLCIFPRAVLLPGRWKLEDVVEYLPVRVDLTMVKRDVVVKTMARIGVLNVKHLWIWNLGELMDFELALSRARGILDGILAVSIQVIQVLQSVGTLLRTREKGVRCWD